MVDWSHNLAFRARSVGVLLTLLLLPAIVLGPAFAQRVLVVHHHGAEGAHGHVMPSSLLHTRDTAMERWHDEEHGAEPEHGQHAPTQLPPGRIVHSFTTEPMLRVGSSAVPGAVALAVPSTETGFVVATSATSRPGPRAEARDPPPRRSGIAGLLLASHALLI